jgi:hypothetical protein
VWAKRADGLDRTNDLLQPRFRSHLIALLMTSRTISNASAIICSGRTSFQLIRHVGGMNSIPQHREGNPERRGDLTGPIAWHFTLYIIHPRIELFT